MASSSRHGDRSSTPGYLPRGGACVSCRRRKMRCDGKHPICTQCESAGRAEDCEYTSGQERSTVQILEANITRLEARIQELQDPDVTDLSVTLHRPYGANVPPLNPSASTSTPRPVAVQDPPRHVAEALMSGFLPYATEIGFFLNKTKFQDSMMEAYPPGHPARPAPALIYVVYLWAIRLSHDPTVKVHEAAYLYRATQDAATALSGSHPHRIMHSIQAEVLLATYFFANGRFFEGKYHVANAVSTAFSAGLHKIRSAVPAPPGSTSSRLSRPQDSTEEGERILAAWTVLTLDKFWAIALEHTPNFEYSTHAMATKVDTPWPLEMEDFEQGLLPPHARTANSIQNFLESTLTNDLGLSTWAIEAKAAVLWERVAIFARKCTGNTSQLALPPLVQEFSDYSALIDGVLATFPSSGPRAVLSATQSAEKGRRLAVGYTILHLAIITLHGPFAYAGRSDSSRRSRINSARFILEIAIGLRSMGARYLNLIMGTAWIEAAQVFFDEITSIRAMRASGVHVTTDERALVDLVQQATAAMTAFGVNIPLTSFQVSKIQETYQTI